MALIEQPLEHPELLDLLVRVDALSRRVARRQRKPVAALPYAQRVLGESGVTLDCGDPECAADGFGARVVHREMSVSLSTTIHWPLAYHGESGIWGFSARCGRVERRAGSARSVAAPGRLGCLRLSKSAKCATRIMASDASHGPVCENKVCAAHWNAVCCGAATDAKRLHAGRSLLRRLRKL